MTSKKKKQTTKIDTDMDFGDLDDMSDDMNFGELEDIDGNDRNPSKLGIARELGKEAGAGFLDSLVKTTAKKSLNPEYSTHYNDAMDYVDFAKSTFEENKSKVAKTSYQFGKEVKKILPFQIKMLDNFLEKFEAENEQARLESEDQVRDASIQSSLSGIFDKQLEIQKAIAAKQEAEGEIEKKERISMNKLNMDVLTSIDNNISNQTAFTLQISKEYFRRSLELQFKSYFIQADMLKTMRDYYKGFSIQFESIAKNTGLPEFVKLNNTERISEVLRTQAIQSTYKAVFSNADYVKKVKANIAKMVSDKVSSITDKVDTVTDQLNMINSATDGTGMSAGGLVGNIAAGMGGSTFGGMVSDKFSPKIKEKFKNNRAINAGANYLSTLANSPSTFFGSMRRKTDALKDQYSDESNPVRFLASKLFGGMNEILGVTDPGRTEYKVTGASALNHGKPAIFDNKVHRSITEVIPMYLSKILAENSNLRGMYSVVNRGRLDKVGGYKDTQELHYDYDGRGLVTGDELKKKMEERYLSSRNSKGKIDIASRTMLGNSLSSLSKDKAANKKDIALLNSDKSKALLSSYLETASRQNGVKFDYKTLIGDIGTDKANPALSEIVANNKELGKVIELLKKSTDSSKIRWTNNQMADVKTQYPIAGVKQLFSNATKLAGGKVLNNIKDSVAEVIAKGFTRFIMDAGRDIILENVISGEVFKFMTEEEFALAKDSIAIFINDSKRISAIGDSVRESSYLALLGFVNASLKNNFELDPEVFQTLQELSPILGEKGRLTEENLVERKLFRTKDKEYVKVEDLRQVVKTSAEGVRVARASQENKGFIDALSQQFERFNEQHIKRFNADYGNAKNPLEKARVVMRYMKEGATKAKDAAKTQANKTTKQVAEMAKQFDALVGKTTQNSLEKAITALSKVEQSLEAMANTEKNWFEEEIKRLEDTKSQIGDTIDSTAALKELDKEIDKVNKQYQLEISTIKKLKETIAKQKDSVMKLKEKLNSQAGADAGALRAVGGQLRDIFNDTLVNLKELAKKHEERQAAMAA